MECIPIYSGINPYLSIEKYIALNPYREKCVSEIPKLLQEDNFILLQENGSNILI